MLPPWPLTPMPVWPGFASWTPIAPGKPTPSEPPRVWKNCPGFVGGRYRVRAGEDVDLDIELDTAPREVEVPADLKVALDRDAKAKQFFETLSYSNKRRLTIPINDAKSDETRARRVARTIEALREGRL